MGGVRLGWEVTGGRRMVGVEYSVNEGDGERLLSKLLPTVSLKH